MGWGAPPTAQDGLSQISDVPVSTCRVICCTGVPKPTARRENVPGNNFKPLGLTSDKIEVPMARIAKREIQLTFSRGCGDIVDFGKWNLQDSRTN